MPNSLVKPVSFNLPPTEWEVKRKELERQQAIVDAMTARNAQPLGAGHQAGKFFVPTSAFNALGQAASAYLLGQKDKDLREQQVKQGKEEVTDLAKSVDEYFKIMQGTPGTPGTPSRQLPLPLDAPPENIRNVETFPYPGSGEPQPTTPVVVKPIDIARQTPPEPGEEPVAQLHPIETLSGTLGTPAVPGDPKAALKYALASQHGLLRTLALQQMIVGGGGGEFLAPWVDAKGNVHRPRKDSPEMVPTGLQGRVPEGRVDRSIPLDWVNVASSLGYTPEKEAGVVRVPSVDGKHVFATMKFEDGKLVGLDPIDKTTKVSQSMQGFPSAWETKQAELVAGRVEGSAKEAASARADLDVLNRAEEIFARGVKTGSFTAFRNEADKFAQTLGLRSADPKVSNTDLLGRSMAERVLASAKALGSGSGFSNTDRTFLEEIKAGKNLDAAGWKNLFRLGRQSAAITLERHDALLGTLGGLPHTLSGFKDVMRIPAPPATPADLTPSKPSGPKKPWTADDERRYQELLRRQ
jgi:hypothetical protein